MTLARKAFINFDINNGTTLNILDYTGAYDSVNNLTGYGNPNLDTHAIKYFRYLFSSYLTESNPQSTTNIVAGQEILVGGIGSFIFDTKTFSTGQTFIAMTSGSPTLNQCTLTTTGRFSSASAFLPTQVISLPLSPSLAIGVNDLIFPDSTYTLQLDSYTTSYTAQAGIPAGTYVIYGIVGQTAIVTGVTYRINEVMVQGGTFTMTGTASIALFYDSITTYQQLSYYANQSQISMELQVAQSSCGNRENLTEALERISTDYAAIQDYFELTLSTDFSGVQVLFDEIASINKNPNFV